MDNYLEQLIKSVEAEESEARAHLNELERRKVRPKRAINGLKRALQRLEVLRSLRTPYLLER